MIMEIIARKGARWKLLSAGVQIQNHSDGRPHSTFHLLQGDQRVGKSKERALEEREK
jgi:hypothetical protein